MDLRFGSALSDSTPTTLRFFGAGGAFSRRYGTTCSGIVLSDGSLWLIDCGRQAPDQLADAGICWHDVAGQVITHVHGDHVYGLEEFAFVRFFYGHRGVLPVRVGGPRPKLLAHDAVRAELWEFLAPSLRYVPNPDAPRSGTLSTYFDPVLPSSAEPPRSNAWAHAQTFASGTLHLTARETVHVPGKPSTSLEIRVGGAAGSRIAWWSGDSTVDEGLMVDLEPRTTVFFHDCTFVEYPGQVHGSFSRLEALPEAVRRKTVLMHHEDDLELHRARAESLGFRLALPGDVYDLETGQRIGESTEERTV